MPFNPPNRGLVGALGGVGRGVKGGAVVAPVDMVVVVVSSFLPLRRCYDSKSRLFACMLTNPSTWAHNLPQSIVIDASLVVLSGQMIAMVNK